MPTRWCVNFDDKAVLRHGLQRGMWLMQYQYSHGGYDFQGHRAQIAATSVNWNIMRAVQAGDWLVAYLPESTFYAVGEVIEPRSRPWHASVVHHADTVARTVQDHGHQFLDGFVRYCDASVLYEDFSDPWVCPAPQTAVKQPTVWQYPQRIDVGAWEHVVPGGVQVGGLAKAAPLPAYRRVAFEIPDQFFERVLKRLKEVGRAA